MGSSSESLENICHQASPCCVLRKVSTSGTFFSLPLSHSTFVLISECPDNHLIYYFVCQPLYIISCRPLLYEFSLVFSLLRNVYWSLCSLVDPFPSARIEGSFKFSLNVSQQEPFMAAKLTSSFHASLAAELFLVPSLLTLPFLPAYPQLGQISVILREKSFMHISSRTCWSCTKTHCSHSFIRNLLSSVILYCVNFFYGTFLIHSKLHFGIIQITIFYHFYYELQ